MTEKLLPLNIEAEESVLGSLIIDPEAIAQVEDVLRPDDFYRDAHKTLYQSMLTLYVQREPADFVTLCNELERTGRLADVGGASVIASLMNAVPTSANAVYYARIVAQKALYRRLIHAAGQIAALAYEETDDALEEAEQLIFALGQAQGEASDLTPVQEVLSDCLTTLDALHERRTSIIGVPTGYRHLDAPLGGLQRSDLVILAARPGTGKCLTAHTLIDIPGTGERKTLEACIKQREPLVYGLSEDGVIRPALVSQWIDSGIQLCYRVRTRLGREVEVTGHHPFLTVHGWKPLHDVHVGHHIAVPAKVACFGEDEHWPLEKVRLLAYLLAEGGLTRTYPIFTNTDPVIIADFKQIIATHFPQCAVKQYGMSYAIAQPKNATTMQGGAILPKNPVTVWLQELGLMGKSAKEKSFPPCVWKWSRQYLAEFLKTLMSCDGSIFPNSKGQPTIQLTVASPQLAKDVSHAFLRFGIVGKYYSTSRGAYRIDVTANEGVRTYQQEIGWIGEKHSRFVDYAHSLHHGYRGHVPCEIWPFVSASAQSKSLTMVGLAREVGEVTKSGTSGYNPHNKRPLPRYRLAAYAQVLDDKNLRRASSPDVYWDEIVAIEPIGEQQVYDVTVPDGANFIANDVFVHNTSFALGVAHNACRQGYRVALFSLEMSRHQLVMRLLSTEAGIDQHRLRLGRVEDHEWEHIVAAMGTLSEERLWIDDTAGLSLSSLRSRARRLQSQYGVDLVIVDYLQLVRASLDGKRFQNREQEIAEISRGLKAIAKELDVPVLALAQLSRAVEIRASKVPQLSDLRESGCLTGDTPVYLPDEGVYLPIKECVGQSGFRVLALNTETWKLEARVVTRAFATGCKQTYKMTTRLGRTIRATGNHTFFTFEGWERLDQLCSGQRIALPRRLPGPACKSMTDEEIGLLGHLIGDGCTLQRSGIQYVSGDLGLAEMVVNLAKTVFGETIHPSIKEVKRGTDKHTRYYVFLSSTKHLTHGKRNPVAAWLDGLDAFNRRSYEKKVPDQVFRQALSGITCFLRHLWATDGCIHLSQRKKHYAGLYYASCSRVLASHVQSLLLRLGINARISCHSQGNKGRDQYHVTISGKSDILIFLTLVGGLGAKKTLHHAAILEYLERRRENTNRDVIPNQIWRQMVVPAMRIPAITTRQMQAALGNVYCGTGLYKQNVSRERAPRLANIVQSEPLAALAQSDVYWDEIVSIVPDEETDVYDLTVEGLHNFVAGDMIVHNSIENDSDVVLFIYRDDLYNPESEAAGTADLIIAKHRNGPTGTIRLGFDPTQTRFYTLEAAKAD